MPKLSLNDVRYRYVTPHVTVDAVRGITYTFEPKLFYALVGPSGCGKTTILSLMAGLDLPTEGDILYEDISTKKMDLARHRRENVSVIYQDYNLLPQMTAVENVMYPMELSGMQAKKARSHALELMETVGLTKDEAKRLPHMLSGGQQQRVAIARTLGTPARIILADEPTGNLDSENSRNVILLLKRLVQEQDFCVVIVTHDSTVAEAADVTLRMDDGKLA
jgi:putative ABC transport system ATP-binding protein